MNNLSNGKMLAGIAGVVVVAGVVVLASGAFGFTDGGIDVRNTACEDLGSARIAVNNEFEERKAQAGEARDAAKEVASDAYFAENQRLNAERHACISRALTADPCKASFEEITRLYEEIMADFAADKGFNEAKFNEREQAKKDYTKCVEEARKPEFYKDKETACDTALAAGKSANIEARTKADASAERIYEKALESAAHAKKSKEAILDAIEKKCNEPGGNTAISVGGLTTGGTGTAIQSGVPACTGVFAGNDPDLLKRVRDLENQLNKAKAAGHTEGIHGTVHLQTALSNLRTELAQSQRSCKVDTDCGDVVPVCCSGTEVGQAVCSAGVCTSKKTQCVDPEVCAGKPAQCVAPSTGAQSKAVTISRTIPEVGTCSQNLQTLDLQKASEASDRFEITGNIPSWLKFDKVGGKLPTTVSITYSCATVQGFGPGAYSASGTITIYNTANELINTIPLNITITVTASPKTVAVIEYSGKLLPVDQLIVENEEGCGAEHWHAAQGSVTALDGSLVTDPGPQCGYGKVQEKPAKTVPDTRTSKKGTGTIEVRGLEGLQQQ